MRGDWGLYSFSGKILPEKTNSSKFKICSFAGLALVMYHGQTAVKDDAYITIRISKGSTSLTNL